MNARAWLGVLALFSTLASAAENGFWAPGTAEKEAQALIGMEYAGTLMGGQLTSELSCREGAGGMLHDRRNRRVNGLAGGWVRCAGRYVLVLTRYIGDGTKEGIRWRVIDAAVLPPVVGIELDPARPEGPYLYTPDECTLRRRGQEADLFHAIVRRGTKKRMDWRSGVESAWGFDLGKERVVQLDVKRVVCYETEPD